MRIIYYSPHPNLNLQDPSGYGTHMREMISAFRKLGHEVLPVIAGGMEKKKKMNDKSLKTATKKIFPSIVWESIKDFSLLKQDKILEQSLLNQIEKFKPDLIYERGNYLQLSGCNAARLKGIRHFMEINAPYTEERISMQGKSFYISKAEKAEKEQLNISEKVIVVSSALKKYFSDKHKINPEKFIVTPNAINPETISVDENAVRNLREKYKLNNNFIIGFSGSIFPYHGVDILLKSFAFVHKQNPDSKLIIVGDGASLPQLEKLSIETGCSSSVIFTGNVPHSEIYNYISLFDIAIMPASNWYGSPVKIFEYGALGKPIIAPDNIPLRDVMENNKHGILINSSEKKLNEAILLLMQNELLRNSIGNNFKEKVFREHTWQKMAEKILNVINI